MGQLLFVGGEEILGREGEKVGVCLGAGYGNAGNGNRTKKKMPIGKNGLKFGNEEGHWKLLRTGQIGRRFGNCRIEI
jgi:hypothetical protein